MSRGHHERGAEYSLYPSVGSALLLPTRVRCFRLNGLICSSPKNLGEREEDFAYFLPTALLTFGAGRIWNRLEGWPWRPSIQDGLAPVSIGLLLS
jgi:hypothetical protein